MLDRKYIVENADQVQANCERRGAACDVQRIVSLESQRKTLLTDSQEFNRLANEVSNKIKSAKDNDQRQLFIAEGRELRQKKDAAQKQHDEIDAEVLSLISAIPNMTHPDVPSGGEEDAAEVGFGKTPVRTFDFPVKDHLEIAQPLDLVDFEAGARVTGSGFYFLKNDAVLLDLALQQFAIRHLMAKGFIPVTTPDLATTAVLQGIGFTPRGPETQIYSIENSDLHLVGTAEITLGGMYADQTVDVDELPIKLCGLSHCFRTEAGAAGRASRGLYRVHQFTKVEMFAFTRPDQSDAMHEELRQTECELFDALEVPYRIVDTACGDLGGPAYRKYDLEAWMPGRGEAGEWGEVTSTSNCTDYQARRLNVRYKTKGEKGTNFVHTLNGTAFATGRAMIAIIENNQQSDGSIAVPKALQPWVGKEKIG